MPLNQRVIKNKQNRRHKTTDKNNNDIDEKINLSENNIDVSVNMATKMWRDIKKRVKSDDTFMDMNDDEKNINLSKFRIWSFLY